ncbi:MAG: hypothetical protein J2P21_27860 [Chloracidobacterium sp.]|nr:hypothetical protein [Chloracidobacterium sp.]
MHELDPQSGVPEDVLGRIGELAFILNRKKRLQWRTELPLIVLGRGKPTPQRTRDGSDSQTNRMNEEQFAAWDRIWRGFQFQSMENCVSPRRVDTIYGGINLNWSFKRSEI